MKEISPLLSGRILNAIDDAQKMNQQIISINLTPSQEEELLREVTQNCKQKTEFTKLKMETIYGIKIKRGKKLSITVEI